MAARQKGSFSLGGTLEIKADAPADARLCVKTKSELTDANSYPYKYVGMIVSVADEGKAYILTAADTTIASNWKELGEGGGESGSGISVTATLLAVSWNAQNQQTVTFTGYQASMNGVIGVPASATDAQKEAYASALVRTVAQNGNQFTFECESIPSIDLPVTIYAGGSSGSSTGGHTIIDGTGHDMIARDGLQFVGASVTDDSTNDVTIVEVDGVQKTTLPAASADNLGKVYQFLGSTGTYKHGRFYECVSDGAATPTYSWEEVNVQEQTDISGKSDLSNLAAQFDDTTTYAIGDRCTYNGKVYRFTSAHTGAWVAGDVTEVTVDGEIPQELTAAQMQAIKDAFVVNQPVQFASNPVGCIIQMMGITAPAGYLACDGTAYNIADFPFLATYFESQFGAKNHFGGDGTTTFAVPDLRGEFLRGTGTNSHADGGNGAAVGSHQSGTQFPYYQADPLSTGAILFPNDENANYPRNIDKDIAWTPQFMKFEGGVADSYSLVRNFTARPTNTSVLYCIKY